jgi:hypothetical protein
MSGQSLEQQTKKPMEMTLPQLLHVVLTESADLLVGTVKMTIVVVIFTLSVILIGWFFSSDLPHQALLMINGR